jgi:hypothetical protein
MVLRLSSELLSYSNSKLAQPYHETNPLTPNTHALLRDGTYSILTHSTYRSNPL